MGACALLAGRVADRWRSAAIAGARRDLGGAGPVPDRRGRPADPRGKQTHVAMASSVGGGYNPSGMYTPSREEFIAAAVRGNLIPGYRERLADGDAPVSGYAALGAGEHSFILESVVGGATWAAYSFVGVAPRAVVRWQAGTATVTWYDVDAGGPPRTASWAVADPTAALSEVIGEMRPVDVPGLPRFWGGAVGWIAYDCVRAFEDLPARAKPDLELPPLAMVVTDTLVIFDNLRQTLKVVATPYVARPERAEVAYERACARIDAIVATLRAPRTALPVLEPPRPGEAPGPVPPSSFE